MAASRGLRRPPSAASRPTDARVPSRLNQGGAGRRGQSLCCRATSCTPQPSNKAAAGSVRTIHTSHGTEAYYYFLTFTHSRVGRTSLTPEHLSPVTHLRDFFLSFS
eukprot:scaffold7429_cov123-Isochrysis_galbana.AAC.2